jgi:hypothetical protein
MRPFKSMLKFRLPWDEPATRYLDGHVFLPIWGPQVALPRLWLILCALLPALAMASRFCRGFRCVRLRLIDCTLASS